MIRFNTLFVYLLALACCISQKLSAQDGTHEMHDTVYFLLNADTAMANHDSLNLSRAYYKLGRWFEHQQLRGRSYHYLHQSLDILTKMKYGRGMGITSNYIASMLAEEGKHEQAIAMYRQCIQIFSNYGGEDLIPGVGINLANEYLVLGMNDSALSHAYKALDMRLASQDSNQLGYYYWQLGSIYESVGDTLRWKEHLDKAYALRSNPLCFRADGLHNLYHDLGWYAFNSKSYLQALAYYDTLYTLGVKDESQIAMSNALSNQAEVHSTLHHYDKALELLLQARQLGSHDLLKEKLADNNEIADLYLKIGKVDLALKYLQENVALGNKAFPQKRGATYHLLYKAFKSQGAYNKALKWHERYFALVDTLKDEHKNNTFQELTVKYETEKKEQKIKLLSADKQISKQRNFIAWSISGIMLLLLILAFLIANKRKRDAKRKEEELHQQLLRSQMNPHFIFNALGSIQSFMYKNEAKKAAGYLGNFASLTRSILEHSSEETISLEEDIETLRNYMELEKMRMKSKFDYRIEVEEGLDTEFILIPPMLLQPFVENAIKHGFKELNAGGMLSLKYWETEKGLSIRICDNGVGINKAKSIKYKGHRSMSMQIFDERRKIFSKSLKKDIEFELNDLSEKGNGATGTEVLISIPIKK